MVVIVISGQPGCGNSTVAKLLAERLKLRYFSVGKLFKEQFDGEDETARAIGGWKTERGRSKKFHEHLDNMQKEEAKKDNVVIDSKLAIKMVDADLKVWLKAPFEVRAKRIVDREELDGDLASRELKEKEDLERENIKRIYGFDYFDLENEADLVIDVSDKTPEQIVDIILGKLNK